MNDLHPFDPSHWFWVVAGDESRYWSSADGAYVMSLPAEFEPTRISSEEELTAVLSAHGLVGPIVLPDRVNRERDRRISTGFSYSGKAYQLDDDSKANITAAGADARFAVAGGAQAGDLRWADPANDFGWIASDNSVTPMDAQTMVAFSDAAKFWVTRHIFAARALKDMSPIPADFADDQYWP